MALTDLAISLAVSLAINGAKSIGGDVATGFFR